MRKRGEKKGEERCIKERNRLGRMRNGEEWGGRETEKKDEERGGR